MQIGTRQKYAATTLPYYGNKELVIDDHSTEDIVAEIKKAHKDYRKDYDQFADEFWTGDVRETGDKLFKVLKNHVTYDVEHEDNQQVKSPAAIIAQGHGDCKHYACFINGVCDALARQGKPVKCKYRFVSDSPGQKVHHVFAVISDDQNEYWVDPVLSTFDTRPHFYNETDLPMALYRVSGTEQPGAALSPRPKNLPMVGNIFKDIAHGMQVNAANAGKGVKQAAHDVAKGAENTVKKVEHVALNVGLSPARNAFLALLDLNAFNLATRMSDAWTNHKQDVANQWQKLGGDQTKLLNAINNGRKHKAYYHNQAPAKKLSGDFNNLVDGYTKHAAPHQQPAMEVRQVPTLIQAYYIGPDHAGRLPVVAGIGEPVSIATMTALASAIIAVFAKWMKPDKGDQNSLQAAKEGVANIVTNASDAIDAGQTDTGMKMLQAANAGAQALNTMQVAAGHTPDGVPAVAVTEFAHPQLESAGTTPPAPGDIPLPRTAVMTTNDTSTDVAPGSASDQLANKIDNGPGNLFKHTFQDISRFIKETWESYKTPITFALVGVVAYKVMTRKKKKGHWF